MRALGVAFLMGALGILALQALLVFGFLAVSEQDPIILNPNSGSLVDNGVMMVVYCGEGSGRGMLDKVPPNGALGPWSKGRTVWGNCDIWYHHTIFYNPHGEPNGFL
jgi:hypothetical protein